MKLDIEKLRKIRPLRWTARNAKFFKEADAAFDELLNQADENIKLRRVATAAKKIKKWMDDVLECNRSELATPVFFGIAELHEALAALEEKPPKPFNKWGNPGQHPPNEGM